jgi:putative transposase
LDEVVISIKKHCLWRAVDADGFVLDALVESCGDRRAAEKLLRNFNRKQSRRASRVNITDRPVLTTRPGRECKRISSIASSKAQQSSGEFASAYPEPRKIMLNCARHLHRFVSIHDPIANLYNIPRHAFPSSDYPALRFEAMNAWREIAELELAA